MKKSIFYAVITVSLVVPMSARANLIGSMDFDLSGGQRVSSNSLTLEIFYYDEFGFIEARLFDLTLSASDVGNTYTVSSGTDFDAAVELLTNGIDDGINFEVSFVGGGGGGIGGGESSYLVFSDTSDPSRVDFSGYNINSFSFTLNSLTFDTPGSNPNGDGIWTDYDLGGLVTFDGTVVPVPGAFLLGMLGLSVAGIKLRKHS